MQVALWIQIVLITFLLIYSVFSLPYFSGERNGYNIPAVTRCPEALEWLSKTPEEIIAAKKRGEMPEKVRRLLGDGYLCMYQNLDMTMYK